MDKELTEHIKKHLNEDYPKLKDRVVALEKKQISTDNIESRMSFLEESFKNLVAKVDNFIITMQARLMRTVFWIVGTILLSLIVGSFLQDHRFRELHDLIGEIKTQRAVDSCSIIIDSLKKIKR